MKRLTRVPSITPPAPVATSSEACSDGRLAITVSTRSAMSLGDVAAWAYTGTGIWEGQPKAEKLRAIANLYPESIHLVATQASGIKSVADLRGKRVAVIGTGASAVQFVPAVAGETGHLTLFQRTAPWVLPKPDLPLGDTAKQVIERLPVIQRGWRQAVAGSLNAINFGLRNPGVLKPVSAAARSLPGSTGSMRREGVAPPTEAMFRFGAGSMKVAAPVRYRRRRWPAWKRLPTGQNSTWYSRVCPGSA